MRLVRAGLDTRELGAGVGREAVQLAVEQQARDVADEAPVIHGTLATDSVTETPARPKLLDCAQIHELGKLRPQSFST